MSAARAAGKLGQRGTNELWVVVLIALAAVALAVGMVIQDDEDKAACEARGGYWYHAYESPASACRKGRCSRDPGRHQRLDRYAPGR